jgi:hypothetical protein
LHGFELRLCEIHNLDKNSIPLFPWTCSSFCLECFTLLIQMSSDIFKVESKVYALSSLSGFIFFLSPVSLSGLILDFHSNSILPRNFGGLKNHTYSMLVQNLLPFCKWWLLINVGIFMSIFFPLCLCIHSFYQGGITYSFTYSSCWNLLFSLNKLWTFTLVSLYRSTSPFTLSGCTIIYLNISRHFC